MRFGSNERQLRIYQRLQERGKPSPLDHRPELAPDLEWAFDAFTRLSVRRARDANGGHLSIASSEILAHAQLLGLDGDRTALLDDYVMAMDAAFFQWLREEREAAEKERGRRR